VGYVREWNAARQRSKAELKQNQRSNIEHKKPNCRQDCQPYWLSVNLKVIQGRWFSLHLKGVCFFLSAINSSLGRISQSFRDMASCPLKTHFSCCRSFNPEFENVPLALHGWNFARSSLTHMANYSCKKFTLYDQCLNCEKLAGGGGWTLRRLEVRPKLWRKSYVYSILLTPQDIIWQCAREVGKTVGGSTPPQPPRQFKHCLRPTV